MKNIPKIESNIIIGYSNFANFLSKIKFFDELSTNKLEISINILKKFAYRSTANATPRPPPMHKVASPFLASRRFIS